MSDSTVIRGDTKRWYLSLTDGNGAPLNLTGCTVWFTAKSAADEDATDAAAVITHYVVVSGAGAVTASNGFALGGKDHNQAPPATVTGAASGVLTQTLTAAQSTALALGSYVYDVQVRDAAGDVSTPINGLTLTVVADVTRRLSTP